jgi:rsbT co-antagonist protein RsbR
MRSLVPDESDLPDLRAYQRFFERHAALINARTLEVARGIPDFAGVLRAVGDRLDEEQRLSAEVQRAAIASGDWEPYLRRLRTEGVAYARAGVGFTAWFALTTALRTYVTEMVERDISDPKEMLAILRGMDRLVDLALGTLGQAYLTAKEDIIARQQAAIQELSTPVLQLRERLLIMPIVGMVDTERARQLTDALLQGIRDRRARVVVMDITGVPLVDSKVANHLVQTVEAAGLMGARVIVTGISPDIAQTLVAIGAELGGVQTLADLQSGFEEATRILGVRVEDSPNVEVG